MKSANVSPGSTALPAQQSISGCSGSFVERVETAPGTILTWLGRPGIAVLMGLWMLVSRSEAQNGPVVQVQRLGTNRVQLQWIPDSQNLHVVESTPGLGLGFQWSEVLQPPEILGSKLRVTPPPGGSNRFFRLASRGQPGTGGGSATLPDPSGTATPPPPNVIEDFASGTAFLYTGSNAVQLGLAPGTIKEARTAVLRGKVKNRDGSPLPGVRVAVLNFPELGYTYTRTNGMFDLAVNGGPLYTLDYQRVGYCPAQRQIQSAVQDFRCVEDVILLPMDPISTAVTFGTNAPIQMATSTTNTDLAGTRSATLIFPPGTCATLEMQDGTTQACGGLTIRATEFTVGPGGPQAMPGPLPPTSAYTYAVELSGDEAVSAGARTIRFNHFIHVYVDNFLGMPAGALVPNGYYDRQLAAWVPQENGVVIKILDTSGGVAQVDITGDGMPDDSNTLASAAFTTEELEQLAARYPAGKTLWRMPTLHFTALDFNCPENPADQNKPNRPGDKGRGNACESCGGAGEVNLSSQIFAETIPLAGVPMALHYSSARVPGYRVNSELHLPLIGSDVFTNLIKVRVDMEIAGRLREFEYPPVANQTADFGWDGYDAYGRLVNDTRRANFKLFYFYPQVYGGHPGLAARGITSIGYGPPLFGNYGQFTSTIGHNDVSQAVVVGFDRLLTIPDHRKLGLGGWSLTPQHRYDPIGKILYRGDGEIERSASLVNAVSVQEIGGQTLNYVAAASDGSLFLVGNNKQILRTTSSGLLQSVSGNHPFSGNAPPGIVIGFMGSFLQYDGWPAALVHFSTECRGIAVGPDDSIYYRTAFEILRVTPDGILHVVLGKLGVRSFDEDGASARNSYLSGSGESSGLAVGQDGTVYFADTWDLAGTRYDLLRKVAPDGRLYTLAGKGGRRSGGIFPNQPVGDGEPAINLSTDTIRQVGVGPDGSVYFADGAYTLRRITPGGILEMALYGRPLTQVGLPGNSDKEISEGQLAVGRPNPAQGNANVPAVYNFKVGADGTVYMATSQGQWFLWKIDGAGKLQRVAGKWNAPYEDALSPLQSSLGDLYDFTVDRVGAITMVSRASASSSTFFIRRIGPAFPGFDGTELQVASRDGGEIYVVNAGGLHLRTLNTLTGATNWLFTYDSHNLVTQVRDVNGLVTAIERDTNGAPGAIVGPYGHRTSLGLDGSGFLTGVTNAAGESAVMTYGNAGLLASITGPRTNTFFVSYDAKGRAIQTSDPLGGSLAIQHSYTNESDYTTVTTNSTGQTERRLVVLEGNGDSRSEIVRADGTRSTEVRTSSGGLVMTNADGTILRLTQTGDPRFPTQTRVLESMSVDYPGGLRSALTVSRSATLAVAGNPLSLSNMTSSAQFNGRSYTGSYDAQSRRAVMVMPGGGSWTGDFDAQGRLLAAQAGAEVPMSFHYDAQGRLTIITEHTAAAGLPQSFSYNNLGQLSGTTDVQGRSVEVLYDAAGRARQLVLPDGNTAGLEYDGENNLRSITPPGRTAHRFEMNPVGLLTKYTPPVVGGLDDSITFTYASERGLDAVQFPDGQLAVITHDSSGRAQQIALGAGPTLTLGYATNTGLLTNLVSSSGARLGLGYVGPIPVATRWSGSITGAVSLQLNNDLMPASQSINGQNVSFTYDAAGRLATAAAFTLQRQTNSERVVRTTLGVVTVDAEYDERGFLTNRVASTNGSVLWRSALSYDALGRMTNGSETLNGLSLTRSYTYDLGGRLKEIWLNGALVTTYDYDANGNRLSRNGELGSYDAQDRLISYDDQSFTWTRNGQLHTRTAGGQTATCQYNLSGGLTMVANTAGPTIEYILDPAMRRIGKKVGGNLQRGWLWNGDQMVAEVDAASVVTKRFVYAEFGTTPSFMVVTGVTYRILADERGSVRLVLNSADGSVAQALDYDEFGRVLVDTNPGFQPFGYASGHYDPDTGLVRFGVRDYDAITGRWTARDPIGFAGGDFSLFNYVRNDPLNRIDPAGTGPYNNPSGGPYQDLRNRAFNGDARAMARFRSYLRTDHSINNGIHADAMASAQAYGRATRVSQAGIFVLGSVASFGALSGSVTYLSAGTALTGSQAAYGTFMFANGAVGMTANAANAANHILTPLDKSVQAAPTSIPQIILPESWAPYADAAIGKYAPEATGPAWVQTAGKIDDAVNKLTTAKSRICP